MKYFRKYVTSVLLLVSGSCSSGNVLDKYVWDSSFRDFDNSKAMAAKFHLRCSGSVLGDGEYVLELKVKYLEHGSTVKVAAIPYLFNEGKRYYLTIKDTVYEFCDESQITQQKLGNIPSIVLRPSNAADAIKLVTSNLKSGAAVNQQGIPVVVRAGQLSLQGNKLETLQEVIALAVKEGPPLFLDGYRGSKVEIRSSLGNDGVVLGVFSSPQAQPKPDSGKRWLQVPAKLLKNLPIENIEKHLMLSVQDKPCAHDEVPHPEPSTLYFKDCQAMEGEKFHFEIDGFEVSRNFNMQSGIVARDFESVFDFRLKPVKITPSKGGEPYSRKLVFDDIGRPQQGDPSNACDSYTVLLEDVLKRTPVKAANACLSATGTRWIQFPNQFPVKKIDKYIKLYTYPDNKACGAHQLDTVKNRITFKECDAQDGVNHEFYITINGFAQSSVFSMKSSFNEQEFAGLGLHTELIEIIAKTPYPSKFFPYQDIGKTFPIDQGSQCAESYTVTLDDVLQGRRVQAKGDCRAVAVTWPMGWGKAELQPIDAGKTQLLGSCEESGGNVQCRYRESNLPFHIQWKDGAISAQIPAGEISFHIAKLTLMPLQDPDSLLGKASPAQNPSGCDQPPKYRLDDTSRICAGENECANLPLHEGKEEAVEIEWSKPHLPEYRLLSFSQTTANPRYKQTLPSMRLPISRSAQLPGKTEFAQELSKQPIKLEIKGNPVVYTSDYEFLVFDSNQKCEETKNPVQNTFYTQADINLLKLSTCDAGAVWAKITDGRGRRPDLTRCAQARLASDGSNRIEFSLNRLETLPGKRWLIAVSEAQGLGIHYDVILDRLIHFLGQQKKKPITLIALGARTRTLFRAEDLAASSNPTEDIRKKIGVLTMSQEVLTPMIDLGEIQEQISLNQIGRILYVTDSSGLGMGKPLLDNQLQAVGLIAIKKISLHILTLDDAQCEVWRTQAQASSCHSIFHIDEAVNDLSKEGE